MLRIFTKIPTIAIAAILFTGIVTAKPAEEKVYICDSKGAYAYHSTLDCGGLKNCTHEILTITKDKAINTYKRKPCKRCY